MLTLVVGSGPRRPETPRRRMGLGRPECSAERLTRRHRTREHSRAGLKATSSQATRRTLAGEQGGECRRPPRPSVRPDEAGHRLGP